jgi:hypothetical protein
MSGVNSLDEAFVEAVGDRLATLPGVSAVGVGGSRAVGTERPGGNWDFAVYYLDGFDPADLRELGWLGTVFESGAWGGRCSTAVPGWTWMAGAPTLVRFGPGWPAGDRSAEQT